MDDFSVPLAPCELHIRTVLFLLWSLVRRHQQVMGIKFHPTIIASGWIELSTTIRKWLLTFLKVIGEDLRTSRACMHCMAQVLHHYSQSVRKGTVVSSSTTSR
jgi:hypothetical protein